MDPSQPGCQRERLRPAQHRAASLSPMAAAEGHRRDKVSPQRGVTKGIRLPHRAGGAGSDQRRGQSEGQHPRPARGPVTEGRDGVRGEAAAPPLRSGPAPAPVYPQAVHVVAAPRHWPARRGPAATPPIAALSTRARPRTIGSAAAITQRDALRACARRVPMRRGRRGGPRRMAAREAAGRPMGSARGRDAAPRALAETGGFKALGEGGRGSPAAGERWRRPGRAPGPAAR